MYFETTSTGKVGDNAQIESPPYSPDKKTNKNCFQFWYHMYGNSIGELRLHLKQNSKVSQMLSMKDDQGDRWMIGQSTISSSSQFTVS